MFDWLFEEELDCIVQIKADGYFDWIDKSVKIFHIINKHDTLKNKMLYNAYGLLRSGLFDQYFQDCDYIDDSPTQTMRIKCWKGALDELKQLPWVAKTSEVVMVL